jgi:hypothetical protein
MICELKSHSNAVKFQINSSWVIKYQSRPQMVIPRAPQTSICGFQIHVRSAFLAYTLHMNILTCAQSKIAECLMTPQNFK